MVSAAKSLLILLLGVTKLVFALRESVHDVMFAGADIDHLKVLYKYCFAFALKAAASQDGAIDNWPIIYNEDSVVQFGSDDEPEAFSVYNHWHLFRKSSFSCPLKMTDQAEDQHQIAFSEVADAFKGDDAAQVYNAYPSRPEKTWFDLSVSEADKGLLKNALKELYISAMRSKSTFYITSWDIKGECCTKDSPAESCETARCHDVFWSGDGQLRFSATQRTPESDSVIHSSDDGKVTLHGSDVFGEHFQQSCKHTLDNTDAKFQSISPELCTGDNFYKCRDPLSVKSCSNSVVGNVGWKDGQFYWKS